jgi:hypothetical protein
LHGGGYISGSIESHRPLATAIARAAGARTLALGYRRAPEHQFPAAVEDVISGYRFLLEQGLAPGRIAIAPRSLGRRGAQSSHRSPSHFKMPNAGRGDAAGVAKVRTSARINPAARA